MENSSPPSTSSRARRSFILVGLAALGTNFVSSACASPPTFSDGLPNAGGAAGLSGGTTNSGGASGGASTASGGGPSGGQATTVGGGLNGGGGMASGGSGGIAAGGVGNGGSASGGAPAGGAPCVDVQPPPTDEWPDATCENWATETEECGADWFANYCDVSCGRCVPEGGTGGSGAVDCSGEGLPNVTGGDGFATRYWDCCQPHCSQFNGHRCSQDGVSNTGDTNSSCNGGGSFACYDEAPHAVSECLSYGHFAKANPNCGGCYRIQFTGTGHHNQNDPGSKLIKGKQMIVKVTNTGSDVGGNQFDLMIPGGGVGQFNACSRQWGTNDLGAQYGGFLSECTGSHSAKKDCVRQECMKIPAGEARDGCLWFVDWFQVADNPNFTSTPTDCPF